MKPIQQNVKCHLAIFNGTNHFETTTTAIEWINEKKKVHMMMTKMMWEFIFISHSYGLKYFGKHHLEKERGGVGGNGGRN